MTATCGVTVAREAGLTSQSVLDWRDVVVDLADLAVRSIPVAAAVLALPAPPGGHVLLLVKTTLSGPVVTLTGCNVTRLS